MPPAHRFSRHGSVRGVFQTSPFMCRLVETSRRIAFVILRTEVSLPVASHLTSRWRSYLPLRSCGFLRHGLAPCWSDTIVDAHI